MFLFSFARVIPAQHHPPLQCLSSIHPFTQPFLTYIVSRSAPFFSSSSHSSSSFDFPAVGAPPAEELALASGPLKLLAAAVLSRHEAAVAAAARHNPALRGLLEDSFRSAVHATLEAAQEDGEEALGSPEKVRRTRAPVRFSRREISHLPLHSHPRRIPKMWQTRRDWRS